MPKPSIHDRLDFAECERLYALDPRGPNLMPLAAHTTLVGYGPGDGPLSHYQVRFLDEAVLLIRRHETHYWCEGAIGGHATGLQKCWNRFGPARVYRRGRDWFIDNEYDRGESLFNGYRYRETLSFGPEHLTDNVRGVLAAVRTGDERRPHGVLADALQEADAPEPLCDDLRKPHALGTLAKLYRVARRHPLVEELL